MSHEVVIASWLMNATIEMNIRSRFLRTTVRDEIIVVLLSLSFVAIIDCIAIDLDAFAAPDLA